MERYFYCHLMVLLLWLTNSRCEAIVCYKCDSLALEACAMSLDEVGLPLEECKTSLQCVMSIVDAVTYRGCSGSTPTNGATYTKSCPDNLCNKGVYPPGRLKCHHCSGLECVAERSGKPHPCRDHYEFDRCYTEVISTQEAYRGCESDLNHTITSSAVQYCDINGCNEEGGASSLTCAVCDSEAGRGCKINLPELSSSTCRIAEYETCEVDTLLQQPETCFVYHNLNRVVRCCTKLMPEDIKQDEHLAEHLQECSDDSLCNTHCLEQQKCLVCDSSTQSSCRTDTSNVANNVCGSAEDSSCYACEYEDWQVRRGCGAAPQSADTNRCFECADVERCNDGNFTRCYKCSSANNVNCANWERPGYDIEIEECTEPNGACISAALPEMGVVLRGCESKSLQCNASLASCTSCQGSFCNKGAFPPQQLRCFQCQPDQTGYCARVEQHDSPPCLPLAGATLQDGEACFEYYDTQLYGMVRGCRSNFAQYLHCLRVQSTGATCHICQTNGCNRSPATQKASLYCYDCERNNSNCRQDQHTGGSLKACEAPVPFGNIESCFLTQHIDGSVSRGCTLDHSANGGAYDEPWDQITLCNSDGCNSDATLTKLNSTHRLIEQDTTAFNLVVTV